MAANRRHQSPSHISTVQEKAYFEIDEATGEPTRVVCPE